ncbi:MAG: AzlC family ABC transporter permease [Arcanobacterium sp.]|nr:AzlC family ABC transporter permease [Arcanobacterium sp.]
MENRSPRHASKDWRTEFMAGLKVGVPIALGYFAVSLAVGLYWMKSGFTPFASGIFSALNVSSTGEFAALSIMAARGGLFELALTTVLVNMRYILMSASLAQRLAGNAGTGARLLLAFGITDEIYAVNIGRARLTASHYFGSMLLPILGWIAGTVVGAVVGEVIPPSVQAAAGILLYAMFVAIVIPPIMGSSNVAIVAAIAAAISVVLAYAPGVSALAFGWRVIIATLVAAGLGATFFPHNPAHVHESARTNESVDESRISKKQGVLGEINESGELFSESGEREAISQEDGREQ